MEGKTDLDTVAGVGEEESETETESESGEKKEKESRSVVQLREEDDIDAEYDDGESRDLRYTGNVRKEQQVGEVEDREVSEPPPQFSDGGEQQSSTSSTTTAENNTQKSAFSFQMTAKRFADSVRRTAMAAGMLLGDTGLRKKGAEVISSNASKAFRPIQQGFASGASGIQRGFESLVEGPQKIQSTLARLSKQYTEQRLKVLLEEERDVNQDIQIGFSVYEDAPQELRGRLWLALLGEYGKELTDRFYLEYHGGGALHTTENEEKECEAVANEKGSHECSPENQNQEENDASSPSKNHESFWEERIGDALQKTSLIQRGPHDTDVDMEEKKVHDGEWEVMGDRGTEKYRQGGRFLKAGQSHRVEPWTEEKEQFRHDLMEAMLKVEWPVDHDIVEDGRYATLLQISVGQEDIDEVISRDIHRTFPEHPLFGFEQGQKALFNLLKAYSLHDLEVGYCQGMAFVAGLLLFYVPEEKAFDIFCRLMDDSPGVGLRALYLPGLVGLKIKLQVFDLLLHTYLPGLKDHLEKKGVLPVLYASQWFLSLFSCPFPIHFCARMIDIMLLQGNDGILLRAAVSVMAEFEAELLMQDDFEELLTYLKVDPLRWDVERLRRVINAAINSPISDIELEDLKIKAEVAMQSMMQKNTHLKSNKAVAVVEETEQGDCSIEDSLQVAIEKQDSEMKESTEIIHKKLSNVMIDDADDDDDENESM